MIEGQEIPSFWNAFYWKEKIRNENEPEEKRVSSKKKKTKQSEIKQQDSLRFTQS